MKHGNSQVSDPGLPDSGGNGFDSCADGVEQVCQLACSLGLPPLLQNKPGEGQHVGVERSFVGHSAGRCGAGTECWKDGAQSGYEVKKWTVERRQRKRQGCAALWANQKLSFLTATAGLIISVTVAEKEQSSKIVDCFSFKATIAWAWFICWLSYYFPFF